MKNQEHYLEKAKDFAERMGHTYIGTEHLLYAIVEESKPQSLVAKKVEEIIENTVGRGTPSKLSLKYVTSAVNRILMNCKDKNDFLKKVYYADGNQNTASTILNHLNLDFADLFGVEEIETVVNNISKDEIKIIYERINRDFPELSKCARNLNLEYLDGKLSEVFGREKEIETIKRIMLRRNKTNVLLTGKAGCGKTAIAEGLAIDIVNTKIKSEKSIFSDYIVFDLSMNDLISGTKYRGDFEERVKLILNEIKGKDNIIIFIDEIHQINSIGDNNDGATLGQILKPALSRNLIKCIGATTTEESKAIKNDKALARRFTELTVAEFSIDKQETIAEKILDDYSKFHNVKVGDIDMCLIIDLIYKLLPNTVFPDNVINVIDETFANVRYDNKQTIEMEDMKQTLSRMTNYFII